MSTWKFKLKWNNDYLLVLGCLLSPMTGFRIWKIGPGEVLCALWCALQIPSLFHFEDKTFGRFWAAFAAVVLCGTFYGEIFYPNETSPMQLLTWLYFLGLSCCIVQHFKIRPKEYTEDILKLICVSMTLWNLFLYVYSQTISMSFLGAPLWYHSVRFSAGATNPHQIAMPLAALAIISIHFAYTKGSWKQRVFYILLAVAAAFLLNKTDSTTGEAALLCGFLLMLLLFLYRTLHVKTWVIVLIIGGMLLLCVIEYEKLWKLFLDWLAEDSNGMGRLEIFSSYPDTFFKNPIVGLGPGVHGKNGAIEYHNTYLEILAMGGMLGGIVFAIFSIRIFITLRKSVFAVGLFFVLYVFGLAGFDLRRAVYWIVICLVYSIECSEDVLER